jgi:small-conductance mechanosensitive channel
LQAKNTEFQNAQQQFTALNEELKKQQRDALEIKQKAFDTELKVLKEQINSRDLAIKEHQVASERLRKESVKADTAVIQARLDNALSEQAAMRKQLKVLQQKQSNLPLFIIISILLGYVLSKLF